MSRNPDRCPTHPGELLREDVIPATGKPKAEIGISRQQLYDILADAARAAQQPCSQDA